MADSSLIGSAAIDINKIKAKLGEISQQNITLNINSQDVLGKIGDIKSGLEALTNKPYDITLNIAFQEWKEDLKGQISKRLYNCKLY